MWQTRQLVEQLVHPAGKGQVSDPHQVDFRRIRTEQVDRFMVEIARGQDGMPYAALGAVAGVAYVAALVWGRLRR